MVTLALVGPPGAGKSTIGRLVANRLETTFADSDDLVAATLGVPVAEAFVTGGEARVRAAEGTAILQALDADTGVLAVGSGAVLDADVRAALIGHRVVFLDVSVGDALRRLGLSSVAIPGLEPPRQVWRRMIDERRAIYEAVADTSVDTSAQSITAVVEDVITRAAIGEQSR